MTFFLNTYAYHLPNVLTQDRYSKRQETRSPGKRHKEGTCLLLKLSQLMMKLSRALWGSWTHKFFCVPTSCFGAMGFSHDLP